MQPARRADTTLPYLGDILPSLPPVLKARLFAAVDLAILWNKSGGQVTVTATITEHTLAALTAIDPSQDGYRDTNQDNTGPLGQTTLSVSMASLTGPARSGLPRRGRRD